MLAVVFVAVVGVVTATQLLIAVTATQLHWRPEQSAVLHITSASALPSDTGLVPTQGVACTTNGSCLVFELKETSDQRLSVLGSWGTRGGRWGPVQQLTTIPSVLDADGSTYLQACGPTRCLLAGADTTHYELWSLDARRRTLRFIPGPTGVSVDGLSCWNDTSCVIAVTTAWGGTAKFFHTVNFGSTWSPDDDFDRLSLPVSTEGEFGSTGLSGLSCSSPTNCLMADSAIAYKQVGRADAHDTKRWSSLLRIDGGRRWMSREFLGEIDEMSCVTPGVCVAYSDTWYWTEHQRVYVTALTPDGNVPTLRTAELESGTRPNFGYSSTPDFVCLSTVKCAYVNGNGKVKVVIWKRRHWRVSSSTNNDGISSIACGSGWCAVAGTPSFGWIRF